MVREPVPVELRAFDWSHAPGLTQLWIESWQEAMPEIDFEDRRGWFVDRLGALVDGGVTIAVAFTVDEGGPGRMAGFATLAPASGHVDQLAVHPDLWGCGIADALLGWAAGAARAPLRLEVNADNTRAVRFYEKTGFEVTGHSANPLSGRPTLIMERRAPAGGSG